MSAPYTSTPYYSNYGWWVCACGVGGAKYEKTNASKQVARGLQPSKQERKMQSNMQQKALNKQIN